jgi:hypothetical protein
VFARLLNLLTLPGVVLHELAHYAVAKALGLEVREVALTSHVVHEAPDGPVGSLAVAVAPLGVNTGVTALCLYLLVGRLPATPSLLGRVEPTALTLALAYLAVVAVARATPSTQDLRTVVTAGWRALRGFRPVALVLYVLLLPVVLPLYVLLWLASATGLRLVVDFGYAVLALALLTGVVVPAQLLGLL